MTLIFPSLQIFFVLYLTWKAKKFIRGHCPQKKMSSIGRYKRNLMNQRESTIMGVYWNLLALFETHNHIQLSINQLRPDLAFMVESILWIIFSEGSVILFTFFLSPELRKYLICISYKSRNQIPNCKLLSSKTFKMYLQLNIVFVKTHFNSFLYICTMETF